MIDKKFDFTQKTYPDEGSEKFLKALKKLDSVLMKTNLNGFQERIHRIAKKIRSIEAHADCYVSNFNIDGK